MMEVGHMLYLYLYLFLYLYLYLCMYFFVFVVAQLVFWDCQSIPMSQDMCVIDYGEDMAYWKVNHICEANIYIFLPDRRDLDGILLRGEADRKEGFHRERNKEI